MKEDTVQIVIETMANEIYRLKYEVKYLTEAFAKAHKEIDALKCAAEVNEDIDALKRVAEVNDA